MNAPARRIVETSTGRIAYCSANEGGATIVLIDGALVTADDMMAALAPHLAPTHRIVAMDRPGHGGSNPHPIDQASIWSQATMMLEACQALDLKAPQLVGRSLGGAVALAAAMSEPEAAAVALAPICFPEPRLKQALFGQWAMPASYAESFPFAWASRPDRTVSEVRDGLGMWSSLIRSALSYGHCRVPVALLGGTHDLVINNAVHGHFAALAIPGATFQWVQGSGHMLHHFHQPLVADTLARLSEVLSA